MSSQAATPRKRQDLRKRGQVSKSHDLTSMVVFVGILLCLHWLGGESMGRVLGFMRSSIASSVDPAFTPQVLAQKGKEMAWVLARAVGPLVLTGLVLGVAAPATLFSGS